MTPLAPALPRPVHPWELHPAHTAELLRLRRALEAAQGQGFRLLLAEWNQLPERDGLIRHLAENHPGGTQLTLTQDWPADFAALQAELESLGRSHAWVQVLGFENWRHAHPEAFRQLNHRREEIAARCPVSLLWWLVPDDLRAIALQAPDFWAWRTAVLDFTHAPDLPAIAQARLDMTQGLAQPEKEARLAEILAYLSAGNHTTSPAAAALHREAGEILESLGRWQEAVQHLQAAEQHYRAADDPHSAAHTLRLLAQIDEKRGRVDEALKCLETQVLPLFQKLGDDRSSAITLGQIARIRAAKGEVDAALALHQEELKVYEGLGDKRSRAVTLGDIARIRAAKGEVDAALALHEERLGIFEGLGDKREWAVTLGDIARIRAAKGEVDAALALQTERLEVNRSLGDQDGIAAASFDLAQIEMQQQDWQNAFGHLSESYAILLHLGRLDGICFVGLDLGQLLCAAGQREEGLAILQRSLEGFQKLGRAQQVAQAEAILAHWAGQGEG